MNLHRRAFLGQALALTAVLPMSAVLAYEPKSETDKLVRRLKNGECIDGETIYLDKPLVIDSSLSNVSITNCCLIRNFSGDESLIIVTNDNARFTHNYIKKGPLQASVRSIFPETIRS